MAEFNFDYLSPDVGSWKPKNPAVGSFPMSGDGAASAVPMNWWDSFTEGMGDMNFLDSTQNGVTTQGWGGMAMGAASALGNAYLGMKQYGLAKDTLKHNKNMFAKNFDAQKRTTNASLEDRQRSRVASNAGAYESVSSYMDKNGIR